MSAQAEAIDPIALFGVLFEEACAREPFEANAMTLATVDEEGNPSARVVLLKSFDERGFVFHTNRTSRKGRELEGRPVAALCFHWPKGEQQVRIEGPTTRLGDEESDDYFASRPRGSQIGAWASLQSQDLPSREHLLERIGEIEARFRDQPVPRPPHWGGFRLLPHTIELWQGRPSRLHERRLFTRSLDPAPGPWSMRWLYP